MSGHPDVDKAAVGKRIKRRREELGISQVDLAEVAGVKPHTMWRYEDGQILPGTEALAAIAGRLDLSYEYLLRGVERRPLPQEELREVPASPALAEFLATYPRGQRLRDGLVVDRATSDAIVAALRAPHRSGPAGDAEYYDDLAAAEINRYTRPLHVVPDRAEALKPATRTPGAKKIAPKSRRR